MSLLVLALLARPGGGSGGAEAPPLRVRAHGAALEHACCRRHGTTPGAVNARDHWLVLLTTKALSKKKWCHDNDWGGGPNSWQATSLS